MKLTFSPDTNPVSLDLEQRYLDAERSQALSARSAPWGVIQSARRRVTAAVGWTVLKITKQSSVCGARGHVVIARPWVEYPGHYENWGRAIRCDCGAVAHMQFCHHHQNPGLDFPYEGKK